MSSLSCLSAAKKIVKLFHKFGVQVLIDGTMAVGHIDVNIGNLAADFYMASVDRWTSGLGSVSMRAISVRKGDVQCAPKPVEKNSAGGGGGGPSQPPRRRGGEGYGKAARRAEVSESPRAPGAAFHH